MATSRKLKQQAESVTQEMFDHLPLLLTAFQVKLVTGWNDYDLAAEVKAGRLQVYQRPLAKGRKSSYKKYLKASLASLVGFKA